MMVAVKLFAAARRAAGGSIVEVQLGAEPTVGQLRRALVAQCPALEPLAPFLLFALDQQFADDAQLIEAHMEVACFPPVSGG